MFFLGGNTRDTSLAVQIWIALKRRNERRFAQLYGSNASVSTREDASFPQVNTKSEDPLSLWAGFQCVFFLIQFPLASMLGTLVRCARGEDAISFSGNAGQFDGLGPGRFENAVSGSQRIRDRVIQSNGSTDMRYRWLCPTIALLVCASTALLSAAEPHNAFLDGLRARKYYDTAIEYLEIVEKDPQTPAEFKVTILYEKAVTLQAAALASRTLDDQRKKLTQAEAYLKQFVSQSPDHPLAATANSQSAKLLLNKAKVEYRQARNPSNLANKAEFQKTARGYIGQARAMYQKAHDDYKIAWEAFKKFIPDSEKELPTSPRL
jgi:hypothetical protein